jgi:hypothetical protein
MMFETKLSVYSRPAKHFGIVIGRGGPDRPEPTGMRQFHDEDMAEPGKPNENAIKFAGLARLPPAVLKNA